MVLNIKIFKDFNKIMLEREREREREWVAEEH